QANTTVKSNCPTQLIHILCRMASSKRQIVAYCWYTGINQTPWIKKARPIRMMYPTTTAARNFLGSMDVSSAGRGSQVGRLPFLPERQRGQLVSRKTRRGLLTSPPRCEPSTIARARRAFFGPSTAVLRICDLRRDAGLADQEEAFRPSLVHGAFRVAVRRLAVLEFD